jgi:hypothetical protein
LYSRFGRKLAVIGVTVSPVFSVMRNASGLTDAGNTGWLNTTGMVSALNAGTP